MNVSAVSMFVASKNLMHVYYPAQVWLECYEEYHLPTSNLYPCVVDQQQLYLSTKASIHE